MLKFGQKTKSYVCFITCDVLLKDMQWYLQSICVATNLTDITGLKNSLLNSVFLKKIRHFDSSPFETHQNLVNCHIFKYCVSTKLKPMSKKERNCLICLKPLLLLLFCPFFYHFDICIIYFWPTLYQQIFNAYTG